MPAKCSIIYADCSLHSAVAVNNKTLANVTAGIGDLPVRRFQQWVS